MEMENKSMSNILSQAKQVETQLVNQQERLSSKEAQLHMQVQKMQEEVKRMLCGWAILRALNIEQKSRNHR